MILLHVYQNQTKLSKNCHPYNTRITALGPIEEGPVCVLNSNNAQGQEIPVGNQRSERRSASSPERRSQRRTRFASVG